MCSLLKPTFNDNLSKKVNAKTGKIIINIPPGACPWNQLEKACSPMVPYTCVIGLAHSHRPSRFLSFPDVHAPVRLTWSIPIAVKEDNQLTL